MKRHELIDVLQRPAVADPATLMDEVHIVIRGVNVAKIVEVSDEQGVVNIVGEFEDAATETA